ncbi:hypothetical protein K438DRAFT_1769864 [Mycena galopus ATCC 62051]|nr:hypothetical protein K438DRAFT_1769864 [Mycena galopus ATCC 62051]
MRYREEVDLLEEMCRVLQFLEWRAEWWMSKVGLRGDRQDETMGEGHAVYALKQTGYATGLRDHFKHLWRFMATDVEQKWKEYAEMEPDAETDDEGTVDTDSHV